MSTTNKNILKLISIGSEPSADPEDEFDFKKLVGSRDLAQELENFYSLKNGFYAFESTLHVFPFTLSGDVLSFQRWNSSDLWRKDYPELGKDTYFFAEDVFGLQFCIKDNNIFVFDGEICGRVKFKGVKGSGRNMVFVQDTISLL
jgi:hypothetical protein